MRKSVLEDLFDTFGFDFSNPKQSKPTAIGYEGKYISDFDNQVTWIVYFTNDEHTEEYGDLQYFDEEWEAESYAKASAKHYDMKYVGPYTH